MPTIGILRSRDLSKLLENGLRERAGRLGIANHHSAIFLAWLRPEASLRSPPKGSAACAAEPAVAD
jgi:hypothetical protein